MAVRPETKLLIFMVALVACGGLPSGFEKLPLSKQVSAYEGHLDANGRESEFARSQISLHGIEAAEMMAEYIDEKRCCLPKTEAVHIIYLIQLRGCQLGETTAEQSIENAIRKGLFSEGDLVFAQGVLEAIRNHTVVDYDGLGSGDCDSKDGSSRK